MYQTASLISASNSLSPVVCAGGVAWRELPPLTPEGSESSNTGTQSSVRLCTHMALVGYVWYCFISSYIESVLLPRAVAPISGEPDCIVLQGTLILA